MLPTSVLDSLLVVGAGDVNAAGNGIYYMYGTDAVEVITRATLLYRRDISLLEYAYSIMLGNNIVTGWYTPKRFSKPPFLCINGQRVNITSYTSAAVEYAVAQDSISVSISYKLFQIDVDSIDRHESITLRFPDGRVYTGGMHGYELTGEGVLKFPNGVVLIAKWRNSIPTQILRCVDATGHVIDVPADIGPLWKEYFGAVRIPCPNIYHTLNFLANGLPRGHIFPLLPPIPSTLVSAPPARH
jgi:hypothetical protein